jgi:RHS repeat-associated protein
MAATNYDTNGVLTSEGWITGTYNALNQPITISSASATVSFGYDPLGRCVKRTSSTTTYLYYDGWNLIQEGASATSVSRIYVHGNRVDEIVADQAGGVWNYHHYDARGHCVLLSDASSNLVEQYSYDAFGKVYYYDGAGNALTDSARGNRFLFTGREYLKDLKLYDYRNRMYQPELGRFMQPDPKQFEAGDYNLYRYCHNDPVNKNDPTGLQVSMGMADRSATLEKETTNWETHTDSLIPQAVTTTISIPLGGAWLGKGNVSVGQTSKGGGPPSVDSALIRECIEATKRAVAETEKTGIQHSVVSYTDKDGNQAYTAAQPGRLKYVVQGQEVWEEKAAIPTDAIARRAVGHSHPQGGASFSPDDKMTGRTIPVMKNRDGRQYHGEYDAYYQGWRFYYRANGERRGNRFPY